jgi:hypothetical protein
MFLLFFGYWELGYLSVAVGVVPLLALVRGSKIRSDFAVVGAGLLQGFHTALHGFGMLGMIGGTLLTTTLRGAALTRMVRTLRFAAGAIAAYLGWTFFYVTVVGLTITYSRQLAARPLVEPIVLYERLVTPLFSRDGFAEVGLFALLSGVTVLGLALLTTGPSASVQAASYSLVMLMFLSRWWPVLAPYNLDLLLSVFPGMFAACWIMAASPRKGALAFGALLVTHVVLWSVLGSGMFVRDFVSGAP